MAMQTTNSDKLKCAVALLEEKDELNAKERLALAEAYFRLGVSEETSPQDAVDCLRSAIEYDPFHPKLFFHLGRLYHRNGDYSSAIVQYRQALKLAPKSQRTQAHLAYALIDSGDSEQKIGKDILSALNAGKPEAVKVCIDSLDELLRFKKFTDSDSEKEPTYKSLRLKKFADGDITWKHIWRIQAISEIQDSNLDQKISKRVDDPSELAVLTLLASINGIPVKKLEKELAKSNDNIAVQILQKFKEVQDISQFEDFVAKANEAYQTNTLPLELILILHIDKFGPGNGLKASEAFRQLEAYSDTIKISPIYHEFKIAMYDAYARQAWREKNYQLSKLLWQEVLANDVVNVAAAHNLAMLSAKVKNSEEYETAWEFATEVRYLHAAAIGDVRVLLLDRMNHHKAIVQQVVSQYIEPNEQGGLAGESEEFQKWAQDTVALESWLHEWNLYYLNARLQFRSPVHILGVSRDAKESEIEAARERLLRHMKITFMDKSWAGLKKYSALVSDLIHSAANDALDIIKMARDPYYEVEKNAAEELARETAFERAYFLFQLFAEQVSNVNESSILGAYESILHILILPWETIQPLWETRMNIESGVVLRDIIEKRILQLIQIDEKQKKNPIQIESRIEKLKRLQSVYPENMNWSMMRINLLKSLGNIDEAYLSASELIQKDVAEEIALSDNELNMIGGMIENIVETVLKKRNINFQEESFIVPNDPEEAARIQERMRQATIEQNKQRKEVVVQYPMCINLRIKLAQSLVHFNQAEEAIEILDEGIKITYSDEAKEAFQNLKDNIIELTAKQVEQEKKIKQIQSLLNKSDSRIGDAVNTHKEERTEASKKALIEATKQSIKDMNKVETLSQELGLKDGITAAVERRKQYEELLTQLEG